MRKYRVFRVLKFAIFAAAAAAVLSFAVMSLWNALIPSIFALRAITFWQALGLLILSKILFGGFRPSGRGNSHWRRRMMERWEAMTPEQREQFKQGVRYGCGPRRNMEAPHQEAQVQA